MSLNALAGEIIGGAIEVHRVLGPGLLEQSYERALAHELGLRGLSCDTQVPLPLKYKDLGIPDAYRIDLFVEQRIIVEIKTVETLQPIHQAQLLTYLRMTEKSLGLLINFNAILLKNGIKRIVNGFEE